MRALAIEQNIPLVELTETTRLSFTSLGQDYVTNEIFINLEPEEFPNYPAGYTDSSHFQHIGAGVVADLVIKEIQRLGDDVTTCGLQSHILS